MDLYDAIDIVEDFLGLYMRGDSLTEAELEAISICLEAAKDKAGV